jgi:hypothetical protein
MWPFQMDLIANISGCVSGKLWIAELKHGGCPASRLFHRLWAGVVRIMRPKRSSSKALILAGCNLGWAICVATTI